MTTRTIAPRQDSSLARDVIHAARYYLWRPRVLLMLATIAIVAGLTLNWSWLVAAGLAPILISTLPCLIMCAFGVCMMCRSGEKGSAPTRDAAETASPPTTLAASHKLQTGTISSTYAPDSIEATAPPHLLESNPPAAVAGCCQSSTNEIKPEQTIDLQPNPERNDPHA